MPSTGRLAQPHKPQSSVHRSGRQHAHRGHSTGQALVEFALVLPVMLLLLLLAVDFGRLFFTYIAVNNAAREGTFYAATHAGDVTFDQVAYETAVVNAALAETANQGQGGEGAESVTGPSCFVPSSGVAVDCRAASTSLAGGVGNHVLVSVSQPFTFLTPVVGDLFGGQVTLSATATGPVLNPANVNILPGPTAAPTPTPTPSPTPTPTPSPTPTPTATLPPGATPSPTPSPAPTATATPVPDCNVPDYKHTYWNNVGAIPALQVWSEAGFTGVLTNNAGTEEIWTQTLQKNTDVPCTSNMVVHSK